MKLKFFHFFLIAGCLLCFQSMANAQNTAKKPVTSKTKVTTVSKTPVAAQKGVHMTFDNEHINIGKVKRGEIRKFDFAFTNTGSETIEIDIVSGCDCTTLDYPRTKILPGKRAIIHVTFDSGKKEASETVDVDVYLKNLDPKTNHRILKIVDYTFELTK